MTTITTPVLITTTASSGLTISGTATAGQVITLTGAGAANWQTPASGAFAAGGDLTGSDVSQQVVSLSGPGASAPVLIETPFLTWDSSISNPTLMQATATSDVAPFNLTLASQAPFASASTPTNKTGGNVIVSLPAPISGGGEARFQVARPGGVSSYIGAQPASPTTTAMLWMATASPVDSNSVLQVNSGGAMDIGNSSSAIYTSPSAVRTTLVTQNGMQFFNNTTDFGGGNKVIGITNVTTLPTSLLAGTNGLVMYANNGQLEIDGYGINFHNLSQSVGLSQTTATSDVAAQNLTIAPQAPFASASINTTPGSVIVNLPAPLAGGNEAAFTVTRNGSASWFSAGPFNAVIAGMWLNANIAPTASNYFAINNSGIVIVQGGTSLRLRPVGGTAGGLHLDANGTQFGSETSAFGSGTGVIGITNAATNPTTNPSGGVVVYSELTTGQLKNRGSLGAVTTMASAGSSGTINSQTQVLDQQFGTCETVSTATPTTILTYTTVSNTGGFMTLTVVSRATTTGAGIAVGDAATNRYIVAYKNVSGTVTLSTAGIVVDGSAPAQTTAAALTSPVLTTSVATNVITVLVTNTNLCTVDSEVYATVVQN